MKNVWWRCWWWRWSNFNIGKSKQNCLMKTDIKTTFKDVAGLEEQKKKYKKLLNS
jgi:ATP-dependent Zn protease